MSSYKEHKVNAGELLKVIPEELLSQLSQSTKVDYYSKTLHGRKMFYLLMYGILESDRLSQRNLEDIFKDAHFKRLFHLEPGEKIARSSISERLGKIPADYFRQVYEHIYQLFSQHYTLSEGERYHIIRVDSTMVADTSGKLLEGMTLHGSKKMVKYSMAFDGVLPCTLEVLNKQTDVCEDNALPKVIYSHVKQQRGHRNVYVLDRGLQSARNMQDFTDERVRFIARIKEGRKYVELKSRLGKNTDPGNLTLITDSEIQLYTNISTSNKNGKINNRYELVEEPFRLIAVKSKEKPDTQYWFVSNDFKLSAKKICDYYKKRWDIEVFFRFVKQELHASHLLSLNQNGMQIVRYITLMVAMLVLIYKRGNNIGYKTAKRRFRMEIRDMITALIVIQCGGDPNLFFKT